jgi:hypothetical protein
VEGKYTIFASPDKHTYYLLPLDPDQDNRAQGNGIIVSTDPILGC